MPRTEQWKEEESFGAFLVTLDIAGFSRFMRDSKQLLEHRERFFTAVGETALFKQAKRAKTVVVHFLGDELRLAFLRSVRAQDICKFSESILDNLREANRNIKDERQTHVKGTVLTGVVVWKKWRKCSFLDGTLPFKAQQWMTALQSGDMVIDSAFKDAMDMASMGTEDLLAQDFSGETGYFLRREPKP